MLRDERPYNEPASPVQDYGNTQYGGMSLQDWFAGQAIDAIIRVTSNGQHNPMGPQDGLTIVQQMARDAFDIADAMLAERTRRNAYKPERTDDVLP